MPPKHVRTVRQLIYWEYAKLISGSAVGNRKNYRFVTYTYKRLEKGHLHPSAILTENKILVENDENCAYCSKPCPDAHWEHIIPVGRGGPDSIDNLVKACPDCNLAKSDRDPFEWYGLTRRYDLPRLVLGKYLKIIFEFHESAGSLDSADLNADGTLDVFDLGAMFRAGP